MQSYAYFCTQRAYVLWLVQGKEWVCDDSTFSNLTGEDWTQMTQNLWFEDFPKRSNDSTAPFGRDLKAFVKSVGAPSVQFLDAYDFSGTKARLISSIPGYHKEPNISKYGHLKMAELLKEFKIPPHVSDDSLYFQVLYVRLFINI
jgi:tyrosyl-DNA phosphodiesterase-1